MRDFIVAARYGDDYVPEKPNVFKSKKDAQDAHEAIRPTDLEYTPDTVERFSSKDEFGLYTLIWNRFVASQMRPAVYDETAVDIDAGRATCCARGRSSSSSTASSASTRNRRTRRWRASPSPRAKGSPPTTPSRMPGTQLPPLQEGDALKLHELDTEQHFTQPPPRFSEATLVKELEENGIGRPSTYATIMADHRGRGVHREARSQLYPTELGFLVTDLLVEHFPDIVNVEFTAAMEEELDEIEEGKDNLPQHARPSSGRSSRRT